MDYMKYLAVSLLIIAISSDNVDGDGDQHSTKSCSKEDGCIHGTTLYSTTIPHNLPLRMKESFHTIAAVELYRSLRAVAHALEFAYLSLSDHPVEAKRVRMTAVKAKLLHMKSAGLMDKFAIVSSHIAETMIPLILDAVEILKDEELVKQTFDLIIKRVEELIKDAKEMENEYGQTYRFLEDNIGDVQIRNKYVEDEKVRLDNEMEIKKKDLYAANLAQKELEEERRGYDEDLKLYKLDREMLREQAGMASSTMLAGSTDGFTEGMKCGGALAGGVGAIIGGLVGGFVDIFKEDKQIKKFKVLMEAYREAQGKVEQVQDKKITVLGKIHANREVALNHVAELRKLGLQHANYGDVESIRNALDHLFKAQIEFTRIINHWTKVANTLKFLKDNFQPGELFLKISNQDYVDRFKKVILTEKLGWEVFRDICDSFKRSADRDIFELYKFLSEHVDQMPMTKRAERQQKIIEQIEREIEITYPI